MTELLINEKIKARSVLVIHEDGAKEGVMALQDAITLASEKNLDLVCVNPNGQPPVCKIMNYGKYRFEQQKREKLAKKNQHNSETSEIQITYTIQEHDILVKVKTIKRLIEEKGNSVRIVLRLRGREMSYIDLAKDKINHVVDLCSDFAKIKKDLITEGRDLKIVIEGK